MLVAGLVTAVPVATVAAEGIQCEGAAGCIGQGQQKVGGDNNKTSLEDNVKSVTNVLLFILGAIAVIMIIIGGIRYATSNGDSSQTKAAKDTILYAVVGLVVAILAYAIVNFIVSSFAGK